MDILNKTIINNPVILRELAKEFNDIADRLDPLPKNDFAIPQPDAGLSVFAQAALEVAPDIPPISLKVPDPKVAFAKPALVPSVPTMAVDPASAPVSLFPDTPDTTFPAATCDEELDSALQPWNADIHSKGKTKVNGGTWRMKKGAKPAAPATVATVAAVAPTTIPQGAVLPATFQDVFNKCLTRQTEQPSFAVEVTNICAKYGFANVSQVNLKPEYIPQIDAELDQAWIKYTPQ